MYIWVRIILVVLLVSPVILIPLFRHTFQSRRGILIASAGCAALLLIIGLYQWPFENYFGGFQTAQQAMTYQHGNIKPLYSIEDEDAVLILSDKASEILHKQQGRYFLISPMDMTRENAISDIASVMIRSDKESQERYVQVSMLESDRLPESIMDNKGTQFEKAFVYNGLTVYMGSYIEDGLGYILYVDGVDVGLMKIR